jgi:hypothetical protein
MGSMRNWVLGAAVLAGVAAMGTTTAQAAEFGFRVRGPVAYIPPCPGAGYVWVNGYMANGYWVAGYWNFAGGRFGGPAVRYGFDRNRGFDRDRGFDHDRGLNRDRGHEGFRR